VSEVRSSSASRLWPASLFARRELTLVDGHQLSHRDVEPVAEFEDHAEGRVDLSALDRTDVVPMQAAPKAGLLLREPASGTQLPNGCSEGEPMPPSVRVSVVHRGSLAVVLSRTNQSCGRTYKSLRARTQARRLPRVDDPLPIFAANLRRLREERGLSQEALALRCDMDPAEVRRIETSRRDPGVRVVARLAAGLDVAPAELLAGILTPTS
jgi:hypothetical protein